MSRIWAAVCVVIGLGLACARSQAGVITSIQRLDTDDVTPGFSETLFPGGLTAGAQAYSDFTFTYGTLPSYLQGADYIRMVSGDEYDSNYQLQLNLNATSYVYLMIDDRYGVTPWETSLGFVDTGDNIQLANQTTSIYRGTFNSGAVALQNQFVIEGAFDMYTVAAQATGDITLTQSGTTGTATFNSLTLQALKNTVNLTQDKGTTLTLTTGAITKNGTLSSTISGGILATPSGTFTVTTNGGMLTIGSALSGSANRLVVGGAGTLELTSVSTSNNFGGGIGLNGGTLRISDPRNLGGTATIPNRIDVIGGTLETLQSGLTLNNVINVNGRAGGTLRPVTATSSLVLLGDNQLIGSGPLTKEGAGTLVIGGSNSFTGPVGVMAGALELQNPNALGVIVGAGVKNTITLFDSTRLNLHSDQAALNYNDPISVAGNSTIDIGRLNVAAAGDFFLKSLSIAGNPTGAPTAVTVTNASNDGSVLHFSGPVTLGGFSVIDASAATSFEGQVQGGGTLSKTSPGTLFLAGSASNTYTGATTVLGGTLALAKTVGAISIPSDLTINGGTVRFDANDQIADGSNVSVLQGLLNANGKQDTIASLAITGGSVVTGTGRLLILTPGAPGAPAGAGTPSAPVGAPIPGLLISGGVTTINPGGEINATTAQVSGGVNTVQAGGLFTIGSGGLTLAGDLSPNVTFLADASTPGRLSLNGNVNYTGTLGTASLDTSGAGPLAGRIDLNGVERTFTVSDGAGAVDLRISASVVNGAIKKSGAGTLRLAGNNSYAGGTTISGGTLELASSAALGTGGLTFNAGQLNVRADVAPTFNNPLTFGGDATLSVDRDTAGGGTSGVVQFTGGLSIGASQLFMNGANRSIRFTGTTLLSGAAKFNTIPAVDVAFSNPIIQSGGTWGFTKEGAGKVTFDGAASNLYTGTTRVNLGTLELNKTPGVNAVPAGLDIFGGTVRLLASNQIADASAVNVNNIGSTFDLNGKSETIASLNGTGGSVMLGSGALTVTQGSYNGVVSGSGMVIQDNPLGGTGASLTFTNPQTFTGGVIVNHGSINFSAQAPGHSGTTLLAGGTWRAFNGSSINFNAGSNILTNQADIVLDGASSSFAKINSLNSNQGSMTISGGKTYTAAGALANSGTLTVGTGSTLMVNSGFTNSGSTTANGTFAGGGTINTSGTLILNGPLQFSPGSTLNVTAGTAALNSDAGAPLTYKLAINASGGLLQMGATQHLASLVVSGSAAVGGASPPVTGIKVLVTKSLSTPGTGALDLNNNALVIEYTSGGLATFNALQTAIRSAYQIGAGTHWTGAGVTSSTARDNTLYGVGYAEASDVLGPSGGMFRGESVDGTSVLARFTLSGDANLDGSVDFLDLARLAQSYNVIDGARSWATGDFNYDGNTDFLDLAKLAQNYNTALGAPVVPGAPADFNADVARAFAEVPEPQSLAVLALVGTCLLCPRRRRKLLAA
jgi:fibronectin-binding autotransporter adhesin